MMSAERSEKVADICKRLLYGVVGSLTVALISITLIHAIEDNAIRADKRAEREKIQGLRSEPFTAYMEYFSIRPRHSIVGYGDEAWFVSDSAIYKVGFKIEWDEYIMCDLAPKFDNPNYIPKYRYYKRVAVTSMTPQKPRGRPDPDDKEGFPARSHESGMIIRYPEKDAICKLVSEMTQYHDYGVEKKYIRHSEPVYVRGDV